jgi:diaminopimelate decarboxylase
MHSSRVSFFRVLLSSACHQRNIVPLPRLLCEPGRSLVASAGVTLYTLGARKHIPDVSVPNHNHNHDREQQQHEQQHEQQGPSGGQQHVAVPKTYVSIDGGMSDNPRPYA